MTWGSQNTEDEAHEQLDAFVAAGGNLIDTAELYPVPPDPKYTGETELIIGRWLAKHPDLRSRVIIATKVAGPMPRNFVSAAREKALTGTLDPAAPLPRLVPEQIERGLAASLARMQTDYVDLLQLHWPDRYTPLWGNNVYMKELEGKHEQQPRSSEERVPFDDVVRCLGALIEKGTIKAWGLSNETSYGVCEWVHAARRCGVPPPVTIQNDFSLLDRRFESELAETCSSVNHNVGLLAYGPLAGGTLSGKGYSEPGSRHVLFPNFQARYHCPASRDAAEKYAQLAHSKGLSPTTLALAWAYSRHFMTSVIIGATKMKHLLENIEAASIVLDKDTLHAIDAIHRAARNPNLRS